MFCPGEAGRGFWPQGTLCVSACKHGYGIFDLNPYTICQSDGQWSPTVGTCKPECLLPELLCP